VRFIRPLLTALSVLALTAAAASAHPMPTASADGLATAAAASGHAVAAGRVLAHEDLDTDETVDENEADETETEDQADEAEQDTTEDSHCIAPASEEDTTSEDTTSEDTDSEQVEEPNHGAVVCGAAQAETPDGYANHGAYVSEIAKDNHGHETSEAAKAAHATSGAAHSAGHGKGHNS
jgi:hypothetical protein